MMADVIVGAFDMEMTDKVRISVTALESIRTGDHLIIGPDRMGRLAVRRRRDYDRTYNAMALSDATAYGDCEVAAGSEWVRGEAE